MTDINKLEELAKAAGNASYLTVDTKVARSVIARYRDMEIALRRIDDGSDSPDAWTARCALSEDDDGDEDQDQ